MGLRAWLTGSARTALRDSRLYLSEWQWLMDYLEEQRGLLGDLTTSSGGSITDAVDAVTSAQSQAFSALSMNLRITPDDTEFVHVVRIQADGLGIEDAYVLNLDKSVDVAASGLLGLDTGTEAIDTWYFLWVGYDPDTQNTTAIFSESSTKGGLTLSGGLAPYTKWRRVGARRNNHVGDLVAATQHGTTVLYDARRDQTVTHATTPGLALALSFTSTTLDSAPADPLIPPTAIVGDFIFLINPSGSTGYAEIYPGNTVNDGTTPGPIVIGDADWSDAVTGARRQRHLVAVGDAQEIMYKVGNSGDGLSIYVVGYEDA